MTFNAAAVQATFDAVHSAAQKLGVFERVLDHEPKSAPGAKLSLAIWFDSLDPYPDGSGLAAVSGRLTLMARAYQSYAQKPEDKAEPGILAGCCAFLAALSGGFTLGGQVRNVDLLGESGTPLKVSSAYVSIDDKPYRVADFTIPIIISDLWTEAP